MKRSARDRVGVARGAGHARCRPRGSSLKRLLLIMPAAALLAIPATASATSITVEPSGDNVFEPAKPPPEDVSDSPLFSWQWGSDNTTEQAHNVRQDRKLFYSGEPTDTRELFEVIVSAGSYHYYCEVHGSENGGMDGKIRVRPTADDLTDDQFLFRWAFPTSETGDEYDVRFKVGNRDWKLWRNNTTAPSGVFGENDDPVDVKPGKTYKLQALSQKSTNRKKRSDWSPTQTVITPAKAI
jgi:plastocyanin